MLPDDAHNFSDSAFDFAPDSFCGHHPLRRPPTQKQTDLGTPSVPVKRTAVGIENDCRMDLEVSRFRLGDLVWAKVKSHPWWPGQIFDPALASALARKSRRESHVLVAFFGDSTFGWFPESELIPFEPNFVQKSKQTSAPNFLEAVEDALEEIGRRVELGLICPCNVSIEMEERRQRGRGLNVDRHLREARKAFKPSKMVAFVKDLACSPLAPPRDMLWRAKAEAQAHAFRVAAFCARNSEYENYFGILSEGGDPTSNNQRDTQGSDDRNVKKTAIPEKVDFEGTNWKALLDMDREENVGSKVSQVKERVVGLDKFSEKVKLDTTIPIPNGTGKPKRSRKEETFLELHESHPSGTEFRKDTKGTSSNKKGTSSNWKSAIPNKGGTDGETGDLRSSKTSLDDSQGTITETFRGDAPVSDIYGGESPKVQVTPKKSMGFKRLVKGLKAVRAELKESSNVDRSVENESNRIGNLESNEMRMDSNRRKKKRKSTLQSERGFDSGRPPKQKVRPSMTPGTYVAEPHLTAARDVPNDKKNLVGGLEEQQIADAISLSVEEAEGSCPVPSKRNSDVVFHLQEENLPEKLEVNNFLGIVQESSEIQDERGKKLQLKKRYAELSSLGLSQKQSSGYLETGHVGRERTDQLEDSRSPPREYGENLMVPDDKGGLQIVEVSGQTGKGFCASSNGVVKDMNSENVLHEARILKGCVSENGSVYRGPGILDLDSLQKTSEPKRKRLKTIASGKASEHLIHDINGAPDVNVHASLNFKKISARRSVSTVSSKDDNMCEQQKHKNIVRVTELFEGLRDLAANPLGEREEKYICDVQKAFANFRKAGLQSGNCARPTHSQEGQDSVSATSAANISQNFADDIIAADQDEQGVAITETSRQLSEAKTSKADILKPEINGLKKLQLDGPKEAKTPTCSQAEASKSDNFRPEISGGQGQVVNPDCQRGASCHRVNGLVKNSKKPALTPVSRKVSVSSSSSLLETDIPVHGLRDVSKSLDFVNQRLTTFGSEAVRTSPPSKVNRTSQGQETALLMRFPQGFALPSDAQLRATFIHFGQLDLSGTRIYHNSGCAQVVYQHAHDAEAALKFVKENHVFGQAPVSFKLRQFSQMRNVGMTQISLNSKESKSVKHEERPTLSHVYREDVNVVHDQGTLLSSRNHTMCDNHLEIESSRSPSALKSCLKKTDDSVSSIAKNGARVTFQLTRGVNLQSMPSTNNSQNNLGMDQVVAKSSCERLAGIPNDPQSHMGSSPSVQFSCSGPGPSSLGAPISTDISHQMLTLLQQVSALVGSSGNVL